jgi:8-oxo-dGTP pyrophosphatase MutT (NUDIX family)
MAAPAHGSDSWKTRPGVRAVVVDDAGRVLALKRPDDADFWPGTWNLPGGGKDPGESFLEGAVRELQEETGITAEYTGISAPFTFPGGRGVAFLFRHPSPGQAFAVREVSEARWVTPDDLPGPLFPTTAEIVRLLVGGQPQFMRELDLTPGRRWVEHWAALALAPWLKAHVAELAGLILGDRLAKSLSPSDPAYAKVLAAFKRNEKADKERVKAIHAKLDTDGLGEKAFVKVLERAIKMGRAEAARAIVSDAKAGKLPPGKKGYAATSLAALKTIASRHLKQIKATTEKRLAELGELPEAADVNTALQKLYDTHRSELLGQTLVAEGYVNGVADVLREYGYNVVYARTMGDDRVCPVCRHFETTPSLARMTIRQFLKRFPLHPNCRCWPAVSPTAAPAPLNWKAPRAKIIAKGAFGMQTTMKILRDMVGGVSPDLVKSLGGGWQDSLGPALDHLAKAMSPQEKASIAAQLAKKRNRNHGKFAAGGVGGGQAAAPGPKKPGKVNAGATAADLMSQAKGKVKASEQAAIAASGGAGGKKPPAGKGKATGGGGDKGGDAASFGPGAPAPAPGGKAPAVSTKAPDHLIQAGAGLLEQLRALQPGSAEHAHVLGQYNSIRAGIKTWNASKGATATPSSDYVDGGNVKIGPPPAFVSGGADKLKTPKHFEIAASQASTKEDAAELAHYFEQYSHNMGHAGAQWDAAWSEIKGAMKSLPPKAMASQGLDAKGKPTDAKPALAAGLDAAAAQDEYHGHLDELNAHTAAMFKVGATKEERAKAQHAHVTKLQEIAEKTGKGPADIVADASKRNGDRQALKAKEAEQAKADGKAGEFKAAEPGKGDRKNSPAKPASKGKEAPKAKPEGEGKPAAPTAPQKPAGKKPEKSLAPTSDGGIERDAPEEQKPGTIGWAAANPGKKPPAEPKASLKATQKPAPGATPEAGEPKVSKPKQPKSTPAADPSPAATPEATAKPKKPKPKPAPAESAPEPTKDGPDAAEGPSVPAGEPAEPEQQPKGDAGTSGGPEGGEAGNEGGTTQGEDGGKGPDPVKPEPPKKPDGSFDVKAMIKNVVDTLKQVQNEHQQEKIK